MKNYEVPEALSGKGYMPKAVSGYDLILGNTRKEMDGIYLCGTDPSDCKLRWYKPSRNASSKGYVPEGLFEGMFPNLTWVLRPRR